MKTKEPDGGQFDVRHSGLNTGLKMRTRASPVTAQNLVANFLNLRVVTIPHRVESWHGPHARSTKLVLQPAKTLAIQWSTDSENPKVKSLPAWEFRGRYPIPAVLQERFDPAKINDSYGV